MFELATKGETFGKIALIGPAGAGKTYTALATAEGLADGSKIALIDTEHGSASKYAGLHTFYRVNLTKHHPLKYVEAIQEAEKAGFGVLIIDSLSHAWMGNEGALELVDQAAKRSKSGNTFSAWRDVTPQHNQLIETILACRMHVIATMRTKTEYIVEQNDKKTSVRKVGLAPIQRDGVEYTFDIVGDVDLEHNLVITKSRCPELADKVINKPGIDFGKQILAWLRDVTPESRAVESTPHTAQPDEAQRKIDALEKLGKLAKQYGPERCRQIVGKSSKDLHTAEEIESAINQILEAQADDLFRDEVSHG